jgi:hypothetical protein
MAWLVVRTSVEVTAAKAAATTPTRGSLVTRYARSPRRRGRSADSTGVVHCVAWKTSTPSTALTAPLTTNMPGK